MHALLSCLTTAATRFSRGATVTLGMALMLLMTLHVADCRAAIDEHHHTMERAAQVVQLDAAITAVDVGVGQDGAGSGKAGKASIQLAQLASSTLVPVLTEAPVSGLFGAITSRNTGLAHRRLTVFLI